MPNYCFNTIIIRSQSKKAIKEFIEEGICITNGKETLKFDSYYPIPDGIEDSYDWCVKNWGTKWCEDFVIDHRSDYRIETHAYSAWNSPIGYFIEISKKYKKLVFELKGSEPACCYNAFFVIQDGFWDNRTGICTLKLKNKMRKALDKMIFYDKNEVFDLLDEYFTNGSFLITNDYKENIEEFLEYVGAYEAEEEIGEDMKEV